MVLNSLFPVFFLLVVGVILKRYHLTEDTFLKTSDRLVYYIFFPVLLFWKIGGAQSSGGMEMNLCLSALCTVPIMFILSIVAVRVLKASDYKAGSFSQACYRFNTYIGMAIVINALGDEGVRYFGIMISLVIPVINMLAVSTLNWFSGTGFAIRERFWIMGKALISNPLILACLAGILYANSINRFPLFLENTFQLMTSVSLPLALLSIGGTLSFNGLKDHIKLSLISSLFKLCLLPVIGYFLLKSFQVSGTPFTVGMIYFSLPTATSIYVLSSQLNSDTELASASIVVSTVLSFFSLTMALII